MTRIFASAFIAAAALSGPALAGSKKDCAAQASIVTAAVKARSAGTSAAKAPAAITAGLTGRAADYAPAVPDIVAWVWSLPADQMTDEVAASYEKACRARD